MALKERFGGIHSHFLQWNKLKSATPLQRPRAILRVGKEVFERGKKERTKLPSRGVGLLIDFVFESISEKPLGQVLGVMRRKALSPGVGVERRPIGFAKLGQRRARTFRIGLAPARSPNNTPVRRRERICPSVTCFRERLHGPVLTAHAENNNVLIRFAIFCSAGRRTPLEGI